MDNKTQIRAWKDPQFRATLDADQLAPNPAGERLVEINEDELTGLYGAAAQQQPDVAIPSEGFICSISGECNGTGESCWST